MQKRRQQDQIITSIVFVLASLHAAGQNTNNTKDGKPSQSARSLSVAGKSSQALKPQQKQSQNLTGSLIQVQQWQKEDYDKYKGQLRATDIILKHEKNPDKKRELFFRRAFVHLMMAQMLGMNRAGGDISKDEVEHLKAAEKILNFYEPVVKTNAKAYASVQYMRGLIAYEYGKTPEMISYFRSAMELDVQDRRVPGLSLIVAEFYYERDQYKDAIRYYMQYYDRLSEYQKDLSDYKTAWCYIGLVDYAKATDKLLSIILRKDSPKFRQDALKDLAFILTENKSESEVIQLGLSRIQDEGIRAEFYLMALESYYAQAKMDNVHQLFVEVLKIQKTALERMKTRFYKMEFVRKEYPTLSQWDALVAFKKEYESAGKEEIEKFIFSYGVKLEENSEHVIKIYTEAYNGKKIGPEKFDRQQVLKILLGSIEIHISLFPQSKKLGLMWSLWIDLCKENSQFACLQQLVGKLQDLAKDKPAFQGYFEKAAISRLSLWDAAYTREPEKNYGGLVKDADFFIHQFPQSKENLAIRKRLATAHMKQNQFEKAIEHFDIIIKAEMQSIHYIDLAYCYFQLKKYEKVIELKDMLTALKKKEATDILREAYLKKAIAEKESNSDKYQQSVKEYLGLQKDMTKRIHAYADMISTVAKDSDLNHVTQIWSAIPAEEKLNPQMNEVKTTILDMMFDTGDFRKLDKLEHPLKLGFSQIIYKTSVGMTLTKEDWKVINELKSQQREYFYSLYVLQDPGLMKKNLAKPRNDFEKSILKISQSLLNGVIEKPKEKPPVKSRVIQQYQKLVWPEESLAAEKYSIALEKIVNKIQQYRKKSVEEIKVISLDEKIALSRIATETEKKCSQSILKSPLPAGLTEQQVAEYKVGLAELAKEYDAQAEIFDKLGQDLVTKQKEIIDEQERNKIPAFQSEKWAWPSGDVLKKAKDLSEKVSLFSALFFLDRQLNQKKISTSDYYMTRVGLLAGRFPSEAGKEYIKQELVAAQQEDILKKWKEQGR